MLSQENNEKLEVTLDELLTIKYRLKDWSEESFSDNGHGKIFSNLNVASEIVGQVFQLLCTTFADETPD